MAEKFTKINLLDKFYQTSSFYPMPVVLISTLNEDGSTNLGPYSLCFPYVVTGGKEHSMLLITRPSCNTALNITRSKVCSINFIPDRKKYLKNCVLLGFPGETSAQKMKNSIFTLLPSTRKDLLPEDLPKYPDIVEEAEQVISLLAANGLRRGENGLRIIMMCEVPSKRFKRNWPSCPRVQASRSSSTSTRRRICKS